MKSILYSVEDLNLKCVTTAKGYSHLMKFTVRSYNLLKYLQIFVANRSGLKENLNTVYCIVCFILMHCKHNFKNTIRPFNVHSCLRNNALYFLKPKPN